MLELVLQVRISSGLEEYLDDLTASIECSPVQRCVLRLVKGVDQSLMLNQHPDDILVPVSTRHV